MTEMKRTILSLLVLGTLSLQAMAKAVNISCRDARPKGVNEWIAYRRDVSLQQVPRQVLASIAADSKYWLWVNGRMVVFEGGLKRGPKPDAAYKDQVDLAPYLRVGPNQIAILLWHFGKDGMSHKDSGMAQLWFQCPAIRLDSDTQWLCRLHPAYGTANVPEPNYRLSESSISFDARRDIEGWQTGGTEGFQPAVECTENLMGTLQPRPIPLWKDYGIRTLKFTTRRGPECDTVIARLPHNMQMTPILTVSDKTGGHRILIETDHAQVGVECLRAEYITRAGKQQYESLGWLNGLTIKLTVEHGAKVTGLAYRETGYDTEPAGTFACSEPFFNRFWSKGLRTIYVNARDTFFDCPDRERAQWWGDIVTILGECFYTYSPSLHLLVRKGMYELCDWQRPDGKIGAPIPGIHNGELPCQMLAAVGRYGFWTYYLNTGDLATIEHVYPAVRRYLSLYEVDAQGMPVFHQGDWNWGDWGENKDMQLLQAMWYVLALESVGNMAELLGHPVEADAYRHRMQRAKQAINDNCWTGEAYRHPAYRDSTDDRVQALAVLSGVADEVKYDAIFRVLQQEEHASPYMEKYVMEALFAIGQGEYALERTRRRYAFNVNHPDFDTLFEGWGLGGKKIGDGGSVNHAWSGGPLAVLPSKMLGLYPTAGGWRRFAVHPSRTVFKRCSLAFPTVAGPVAVSYRFSGSQLTWQIEVPRESFADVLIPWTFTTGTLDGRSIASSNFVLGEGKHLIRLNLSGN